MVLGYRNDKGNWIAAWDIPTEKKGTAVFLENEDFASVAMSPDGKMMAAAMFNSNPNGVRVWNVANGKELFRLPANVQSRNELSYSPDGKLLALTGYDGNVSVWEAANGKEVAVLKRHEWWGTGLAFSPDSKMLASGDFYGKLTLGPLDTKSKAREWQLPASILSIVYAPDGRHLVVGLGNGTAYVLRLDQKTPTWTFPPLEPDWVAKVRGMTPEEQVQAVVEELKRRNPDYDGQVTPNIKNGAVLGLNFGQNIRVRDFTPLQALPKLETLDLSFPEYDWGPLLDLSLLRGLKLKSLGLTPSNVTDLSPLQDMEELTGLFLNFSHNLRDLSPLKKLRLRYLHVGGSGVSDLSPLKDMDQLGSLVLFSSLVSDLTPIKGKPLGQLGLENSRVTDLSPLEGMSLGDLTLEFLPYKRLDVVRGMKTVTKINGKPPAEFWKEFDEKVGPRAEDLPPLDPKWVERVKAMTPDQQVEEVTRDLERRNPGFDGKNVRARRPAAGELALILDNAGPVADLTPVRVLPELKELHYFTPQNHHVSGRLSDLLQLKGLPLTRLSVRGARLFDLSPLEGMPLVALNITGTFVNDLSPLRGMRLEVLFCEVTKVSDLTPLKGMPLKQLTVADYVRDLAPLRNMPLADLGLGWGANDLSPLESMPLNTLGLRMRPYGGIEALRSHKTLKAINSGKPEDFLKAYDAMMARPAPLDPAWVSTVRLMKPEEQVGAIVEELKRRNPGFDGQVNPAIQDGKVTGLTFKDATLRDLSPLSVLPGLQTLHARRPHNQEMPVLDLMPLRGLPLKDLDLAGNNVNDLSPLAGLPLEALNLGYTPVANLKPLQGLSLQRLSLSQTRVTDLAPLQGMPLTSLWLDSTPVTDLSPLRGMPLTHLDIMFTHINDLTPLQNAPLKTLALSPKLYKGLEIIQGMKSLEQINSKEPADYWKEFARECPRAKDLPPLNEKWLQLVKDLPAERRVKFVVEELKERNPGWGGEVVEKRDEKGLSLTLKLAEPVGDLTPLEALTDLTELRYATVGGYACGRLADLEQFKGLSLKSLTLLKARVVDLSPLKGMPLEDLNIHGTWVTNLSPLEGMPLKALDCSVTCVTDLSPLQGMPLKSLHLDLKPFGGIEKVRAIKTLETINGKPAAEFWKEYDALFGPPK